MWLIVGLGNPGREYERTRHNIGFLLVDQFLQDFQRLTNVQLPSSPRWQSQFKAELCKLTFKDQDLILLKPQTFMNLSGEAVVAARGFFKIPIENVVTVQDEVDLPFGQIRVHFERGHGGHNGIRSITQLMGSNAYHRLRMGVGKPTQPGPSVADHVLGPFNKDEESQMNEVLGRGCQALLSLIQDGYAKTATRFNV